MFDIQGDGSLRKTAELVAQDRTQFDRFELGESREELVAGFSRVANKITVFTGGAGGWQEAYAVDGVNHRFFGDELLVLSDSSIRRYRSTTGEMLGSVAVPAHQMEGCQSYPTGHTMQANGNLFAVVHSLAGALCGSIWHYDYFRHTSNVDIYQRSEAGDLVHQFTYVGPGSLSLLDENEIAFTFDPQTDSDGVERTVYRRSAANNWERGATMVVDFSASEWHGRGANYLTLDDAAFGNGLMPVGSHTAVVQPTNVAGPADASRILFYQRRDDWELTQEIQVSDPVGSKVRRVAGAGNSLVVAHTNPQRSAGNELFPLSVSLLNRDDDDRWYLEFEQTVPVPRAANQYGGDIAVAANHVFAAYNDVLLHVYVGSVEGSAVCDYSDAHLYDGWGWNLVTQASCAPQQSTAAAGCDYGGAAENGGWGWNASTQQSCAPVDESASAGGSCDYSDAASNAGWGWDAVNQISCPPVLEPQRACDYTNADLNSGWGWDAVNQVSCPPM